MSFETIGVIDKMIGGIETINGAVGRLERRFVAGADGELNVCASLWASVAASIRVPAQAGI